MSQRPRGPAPASCHLCPSQASGVGGQSCRTSGGGHPLEGTWKRHHLLPDERAGMLTEHGGWSTPHRYPETLGSDGNSPAPSWNPELGPRGGGQRRSAHAWWWVGGRGQSSEDRLGPRPPPPPQTQTCPFRDDHAAFLMEHNR